MKVKILSGNLAGTVQDLPDVEAEVALATGFAEKLPEPSEPGVAAPVSAEPATPESIEDQETARRSRRSR